MKRKHKGGHRRRHHNTTGERGIRNGTTLSGAKKMARKFGIPFQCY